MANTTNLGLPLMAAAQSQKHITHNDAILSLDVVVQLSVKSTTLTAPPGSPADGDRYLIGSGATGAWASKDLNITYYTSGAWVFLTPRNGWMCWDEPNSVMLVWTGSSWQNLMTAGGTVTTTTLNNNTLPGKLTLLGIGGATPDATNKLSVNSPGVLLNHGGSDVSMTLNKNASANDAAVTMQDGFSTRVRMGLLGSDDLTLKVSPDGSTFYTSMVIDKDNGQISFEQLLGAKQASQSIASNAISITSSYVVVSSAGTINTFNGGFDGAVVVVQNTSGGTVTITNAGNIKTPGAANLVLDSWNDAAIFVCNGGSTWLCVGFSNNG